MTAFVVDSHGLHCVALGVAIRKAVKLHVHSKKEGGHPAEDNMVLGCGACNDDMLCMGTRDLLAWMMEYRPLLLGTYLLRKLEAKGL